MSAGRAPLASLARPPTSAGWAPLASLAPPSTSRPVGGLRSLRPPRPLPFLRGRVSFEPTGRPRFLAPASLAEPSMPVCVRDQAHASGRINSASSGEIAGALLWASLASLAFASLAPRSMSAGCAPLVSAACAPLASRGGGDIRSSDRSASLGQALVRRPNTGPRPKNRNCENSTSRQVLQLTQPVQTSSAAPPSSINPF